MTSVVEICNMALAHCRAGSINNINEFSLQAQQCRLWFDITRDKALTETNWKFARTIQPLALTTEKLFNYAFAYRYPADCLKMERLVNSFEEITSEISGASRYRDGLFNELKSKQIPHEMFNVNNVTLIGANLPDLRIDYTKRVTDPNLFSIDFIHALSHLLASNIAIPITGVDVGRRIRSDSLTLYQQYLSSAVAGDSNEKYYTQPESEFVTARD